jgi:hypothetical protein
VRSGKSQPVAHHEMIRGTHRAVSIRRALVIASQRVEIASINANPLTTNAVLAMIIRCGDMMSITASLMLDDEQKLQ